MCADCVDIGIEKITGVIQVGGYTFCTPGRMENTAGDLASFSISRSRGTPIAQLQFQVFAWIGDGVGTRSIGTGGHNTNLGDKVVVKAGTGANVSALPTLFTGYITVTKVRPHWSDSRKVIIEFTAEDVFAKMKVGGKFSRRFKSADEAFAVITGGKRRQGGNMTQLKKFGAGRQGVSFPEGGSGSSGGGGEHSPLVKTPDPTVSSPKGASPNSGGKTGTHEERATLEFSQRQVNVIPGSIVFLQVLNTTTGQPIDHAAAIRKAGKHCCMFLDTPPRVFSGGSSTNKGLQPGEKTFPVSFKVGSSYDANADGFEFTVTGSFPTKATYVDPTSGATCTVQFTLTPPHTHEDITQGGPAVGSYAPFQV